MPPIVLQAILALIQNAPQVINETTALYTAIKGDLSATDQATIDAALADAQSADALATKQADEALDAASKR